MEREGESAVRCPSATLNLTVRLGGDRRWTLQQIAGLPGVLNLIKQMPGGIMSEHPGGKVTEQGERCVEVKDPD